MTTVHLQGPVKGVKSSEKICSHLRHSQTYFDFEETVFRTLGEANVAGWEFRPGGDDYTTDPTKKKNVAPPQWYLLIDWGKKPDGSDNIERVSGDPIHWELGIGRISPEETLNEILNKLWGTKECPTYFCKKDSIIAFKKKAKDSSTNLWAEYARKALQEKLADKIARTQDKLRAELIAARNSEAFEQDRIEYHDRCIADEIKSVLLKFKDVAKPHVIKMAMDEFVCHEIMDSLVNMTGSDVDSFYDGDFISPVGKSRQPEVDNLLSHAY